MKTCSYVFLSKTEIRNHKSLSPKLAATIATLLLTLTLSAQERISMVSYNVENLFDCIDDTLKNDNAFIPEATRRWTRTRYRNKLHAIARTLATIGGDHAPDIVALCEVENDSVMHELTHHSALRNVGYRYLMTASDDPRGIDVALLYKPSTFSPFAHRALKLAPEIIAQERPTRDVLIVSGELHTGDTLDIIVCHLPSRLNGKRAATLRASVVDLITQAIDSVSSEREMPHIIVMGDFNDTPHAPTLAPLTREAGLTCITEHLEGSYRYKGKWEQIDHVYLSPSLLTDHTEGALTLAPQGAWNFAPDFLIEHDPIYGGWRPLRTYNGVRYMGGTSDHLPVCFELIIGF